MAYAAYPDRNPSPNALTPRRAAASIRVAADEAALACLNPGLNLTATRTLTLTLALTLAQTLTPTLTLTRTPPHPP